jgi:hypothetical protein
MVVGRARLSEIGTSGLSEIKFPLTKIGQSPERCPLCSTYIVTSKLTTSIYLCVECQIIILYVTTNFVNALMPFSRYFLS